MIALAYQYYPRWYPDKESLHDFLVRSPSSPETQALHALVADQLEDNTEWHELIQEIEDRFPDIWMTDGRPPGVELPSYQLVVALEHSQNAATPRYLSFRLSFLVPVFDFHESERDARKTTRYLRPSPESVDKAQAIAEIITRRMGNRWLPPEVGATPIPGIGVGKLTPGEATLADALFEDGRRW